MNRDIEGNLNTKAVASIMGGVIVLIAAMVILLGSFYVVDEGHVGIVKQWGRAVSQETPGLHFKTPFRDSVEEIDIRARKSVQEMSAADKDQLSATAIVSFNWSIAETSAMDVYKRYGGLAQFEDRILNPLLRSTSKAGIASFTAEEIIQNRSSVMMEIEGKLETKLAPYAGVSFDSVQLENIAFSEQYRESIELKQRAKNAADQATQEVRKLKTEAEAQVNSANAQRDSDKAIADGRAYSTMVQAEAEAKAITLLGLAEAEAMTAQAKAIEASPALVDYTRAKGWNGAMPTTIMGGGESIMWQMAPAQ